MNIKRKKKDCKYTLKDLAPGIPFKYQDEIYMKMKNIEDMIFKADQCRDDIFCVNLRNGYIYGINRNLDVEMFVCDLVERE